jgi:hypothetical protein
MNNRWKAKFARQKLCQFIIRMLASQAHNGFDDGDQPCLPLQVTREAMLGRFLIKHPDLEPFRAELSAEIAQSFGGLPEFSVNRILWDELAPV